MDGQRLLQLLAQRLAKPALARTVIKQLRRAELLQDIQLAAHLLPGSRHRLGRRTEE